MTANGQAIVNGWNVNQNLTNTGTVTVGTNGKLELTFGPNVNTKTAINYIEANPAVGGSSFLEPTPFVPPGQEASGPPATADEAADLIDADGANTDSDPTLVIDPVFSAQSGTGSLKVNFGATVTGWDTDLGANYNAGTGYGWTQTQASQCFARNGSTQITDTLCRAENRWFGGWPGGSWSYAPTSWEADLPAGTYNVTIGWGDSVVSHTNVIAANGVSFVNGPNNYQNQSATHVVTVGNDGKLNLTFGSQFTYTAINYIEATPTGGGGGGTTTTTQPTTTTTTPTSGPVVSYTKHYTLAARMVATEVDGVVHYHAADHLGSTTLSTHQGQNGQIVDTALYFPYGALRAGSPAGAERGYTGQVDDSNTGLMFYNARYYDPITTRFTQADAILDGTNRYRYVHANPMANTDPTGECSNGMYCNPTPQEESRWAQCGFAQMHGSCGSGGVRRRVAEIASNHQPNPCDYRDCGFWYGFFTSPLASIEGIGYLIDGLIHEPIDTIKGIPSGVIEGLASCVETWQGAGECTGGVVSGGVTCRVTGCRVPARFDRATPSGRELLLACLNSFSAETLVLLGDGESSVPISELRPGDEVWSFDPVRGVGGARPLRAVWPHGDDLIDLSLGGGTLRTTEDHHFWNATDEAWQEIGDFELGDAALASDGSLIEVKQIDRASQSYEEAYDLTVYDLSSYFVGVAGSWVLVHNCDIPWSSPVVNRAARELDSGALSVYVDDAAQAAELYLGYFHGAGYRNTTGMSPTEAKTFYGTKSGSYHWDGPDPNHDDLPHLQVHTHEGDIVRIFFP